MPLVVYFSEVNVRLHQAGLGLVVAQARAGIELFDNFERALDDVERAIQSAGYIFELVRLHLLQIVGDDLLSQRVLRVESL